MKHEDTDLRRFEREMDRWRERVKDANDRKTYDEVFDKQTLMSIYKLFTDEVFDILDFPISTGKEGNVFRAVTKEKDLVAVKIYRLTNASFKDLGDYILGDPRFYGVATRFPNVIFTWAKKEFANLEKFAKLGIRVPHALALHRNILVMEYIGTPEMPARTMRETQLDDPEGTARFMLDTIDKAYKGGIVHGDMSEYNVLMTEEGPVVIDLAQAVLVEHWRSQELLERDVRNVARFFKKFDVEVDVKKELEEIRRKDSDDSEDS